MAFAAWNAMANEGGRIMIGSEADGSAMGATRVVLFPLSSQVGEVRAAAAILFRKRSAAAAARFRRELAQRKFAALEALGFGEDEQDEAVGDFLSAVERELAELHYERIRLHL